MHEWIPTWAATPGRAAATTSRLDATHTGDSTGRAVATRDAHPAVGIGSAGRRVTVAGVVQIGGAGSASPAAVPSGATIRQVGCLTTSTG